MPAAHIIGWSHLPFGKLDALDLETLVSRATTEALRHAHVSQGRHLTAIRTPPRVRRVMDLCGIDDSLVPGAGHLKLR